MPSLYDHPDIYDLIENDDRFDAYKQHWERIFKGVEIHTLLDVSIGSGAVTLPLAEMGIELHGSDLSEAMLNRCKKKAECRGYTVELKQSDFRELDCWRGRKFDCVASTGNSLAYVTNDEVADVVARMDSMVSDGGYLYLDTRNWDSILRERQRFYLYNPFFDGETRVNLIQVWDYLDDGSMTFNLLYTFERENRIFRKEIFEEHYHPIPRKLLTNKLTELGYEKIRQSCFPAFLERDAEEAEWYCILARKNSKNRA